jgi:uncharacterized YceG family protein
MDDGPPRLTVAGGEGGEPGQPGGPPGPKRHGAWHYVSVVLGILIGAAAIVVAVVLLRGNGSEAAPPTITTTVAPPEPVLRIVFPEGFTRLEMAERIEAVNEIAVSERGVTPALSSEEYVKATTKKQLTARESELPPELAADPKVKSFEGFLFPATYDFTPSTTSAELVSLQLEAFGEAWAELDLTYASKRNLTPYDVLIIASMIEGEVRVAKERALVAAVIYNRLKKRMPLGIDATLRYGLDIPATRAIRQSELEDPTPYNTRIHRGLPPTPINNPGLAALQAAAHPAKVNYLYFVRKKDCKSHFFTASEAEFLAALEKPRC